MLGHQMEVDRIFLSFRLIDEDDDPGRNYFSHNNYDYHDHQARAKITKRNLPNGQFPLKWGT